MNKEFLDKLKCQKKAYRGQKQGQVGCEECREPVQVSRDQVRKVKALIELKMTRDIKDDKRACIGMLVIKGRLGKRGWSPWGKGHLVIWDMERAEVPNDTSALIFTSKGSSHTPWVAERDWGDEPEPPTAGDQGQDHLRNLEVDKCTGPDEMQAQVPRELADEVVNPLSIRFEKSWLVQWSCHWQKMGKYNPQTLPLRANRARRVTDIIYLGLCQASDTLPLNTLVAFPRAAVGTGIISHLPWQQGQWWRQCAGAKGFHAKEPWQLEGWAQANLMKFSKAT